MEANMADTQQATQRGKSPLWLRALIWIVAAFVLLNIVGAGLFFALENRMGQLARLALVAATLAVPLWKWGGINVLRTWGNPATASFIRRDDPATGGYLFSVQPARAARMPALPLFIVGLLLLIGVMLGGSFWAYLVALVFLGVGLTFVLPGARERQPVSISVSADGIQGNDITIPLEAVADLQISHRGLVVDPDTPMPTRNGVPLSTMAGRHMGRRQAERGYAVAIRADGESKTSVLAGGLTADCAHALAADLAKAVATVAQSAGATGAASN